ncbi:MAG: hypothetical protein M1816_004779 [Peltula sp. TS41687]|nr:MAG: hypothetical protein M1816_004779 [Peltula sp. TS41687]
MPSVPASTVPTAHNYGVSAGNQALKLPLPSGHHPLSMGNFAGTFTGTQSVRDVRDTQNRQVKPMSPLSRAAPHAAVERAQKRKSVEDNTIVPSLQIPPTINDSKGSLAEFAAQITCLFWFESYHILRTVEDSKNTPVLATRLVPESHPTSGFRKWATTILTTTQVTQNVILLALLFIYRLKKQNPTVKGKSGSEFRLLTVALMLGNKFLDDNTYTNKTWAEVSGISVQEIHIMEVEFLSNMKYSLFVSESEWGEWHVKLGRFWNYFENASRAPLDSSRRPSGPPTPTSMLSPSLPPTPSSSRTPTSFLNPYNTNPLGYPYPPSIPSHIGAYIPQPVNRMPEIEQRPASRKRSRDESAQEPPPKRVERTTSLHPGLSNHDQVTSARSSGIMANVPCLPAPNPSSITTRKTNDLYPSVSAPRPVPGGSIISTIFGSQPNTVRPLLSLAPSVASHTHPVIHNFPSGPEESRRQSPYPVASTASPASAFYTAPSTSQSNLSPSYILTHRNSPYRPVREVSTLLVPPQSGVIQGTSQHLSYDQMHYHPLGKARNEYRTGVVPYLHHDAWPSSMHQGSGWPALPQANGGK